MQITFIGNPENPDDKAQSCEMHGLVFFRDQPTDVSTLSDAAQKKLAANKHFSVSGERRKPRKADPKVEAEPE
jgi:hypothetical protein